MSPTGLAASIVTASPSWIYRHCVGCLNEVFKKRMSARDAGVEDTNSWSTGVRRSQSGLKVVQSLRLLFRRRICKRCTAFLCLTNFGEIVQNIERSREVGGCAPYEGYDPIIKTQSPFSNLQIGLFCKFQKTLELVAIMSA